MNVFPLGSYDMIIGMGWLEKYKLVLNLFDKIFTYGDEDKIVKKVNVFSKHVSLRKISALQLGKCLRKGCNIYAVNIPDVVHNENPTFVRDHPVLSEFMDVFAEEIPGLPPPREIDFSIEIIPGFAPMSKVPYRISICTLI